MLAVPVWAFGPVCRGVPGVMPDPAAGGVDRVSAARDPAVIPERAAAAARRAPARPGLVLASRPFSMRMATHTPAPTRAPITATMAIATP